MESSKGSAREGQIPRQGSIANVDPEEEYDQAKSAKSSSVAEIEVEELRVVISQYDDLKLSFFQGEVSKVVQAMELHVISRFRTADDRDQVSLCIPPDRRL